MTMLHRAPRGRGFSYYRLPRGLQNKNCVTSVVLPKQHSNRCCSRLLLRRDRRSERLEIEWIESLAIPPAWREVVISNERESKIYAIGRDNKGRRQYRYNPSFVQAKQLEKFDRLTAFASQLSVMRELGEKHLSDDGFSRRKVLACMVRLLDCAYFRPGNDRYTKENDTFGLTTLRSRHLDEEKGEILFRYIGKSGKQQQRRVDDPELIHFVKELDDLPGYRLFQYYDDEGKQNATVDELNSYIAKHMGEAFSAKDFRTWAGTSLAAQELDHLVENKARLSSAQRKKLIGQAVAKVADALGNTPATARSSYIDPRVFSSFDKGITLRHFLPTKTRREIGYLKGKGMRKNSSNIRGLSKKEAAVLHLLEANDLELGA